MPMSKFPLWNSRPREQRRHIEEKYEQEWLENREPRFRQELDRLKTADAIKNNFHSQVARTRNQADKASNRPEIRNEYNRANHLSLDDARDNTAFANELTQLEETSSGNMRARLGKPGAGRAPVREDFISKLRNNIETAQQQLDEVNKTLKNIPFGQERYRFRSNPARVSGSL